MNDSTTIINLFSNLWLFVVFSCVLWGGVSLVIGWINIRAVKKLHEQDKIAAKERAKSLDLHDHV